MTTYTVSLQTVAAHVRDVEADTPAAALAEVLGDAPGLCHHCTAGIELGDWSDGQRPVRYRPAFVTSVTDGSA